MVLLVKPVGQHRMQAYAMRIVPVFGVWIRKEVSAHATVERPPASTAIGRLEDSAARHADVHVARIAGVDQDRMQLRPIGCAGLIVSAPGLTLRMLVQAVDATPCGAAVVRTKQPLR